MIITSEFHERLTNEQLGFYEAAADAVYGVSTQGLLSYTNPGWGLFASENGGDPTTRTLALGSSVFEVLPEVLRDFYRAGFAAADARPWGHDYECSSPAALRTFHMHVFPLRDRGVIVTNSLLVERPHAEVDDGALDYHDQNGIVHMCGHCRRVRTTAGQQAWHFVPALLRQPAPKTSHGLCPPCFAYHYPDPGPGD